MPPLMLPFTHPPTVTSRSLVPHLSFSDHLSHSFEHPSTSILFSGCDRLVVPNGICRACSVRPPSMPAFLFYFHPLLCQVVSSTAISLSNHRAGLLHPSTWSDPSVPPHKPVNLYDPASSASYLLLCGHPTCPDPPILF